MLLTCGSCLKINSEWFISSNWIILTDKHSWIYLNIVRSRNEKRPSFQTTCITYASELWCWWLTRVEEKTCSFLLVQIYHLTHKVPFSIGNVACNVSLNHLQVQRPASIRPRAELQITALHIKGEPSHIDVAGALKYPCEHNTQNQYRKQTFWGREGKKWTTGRENLGSMAKWNVLPSRTVIYLYFYIFIISVFHLCNTVQKLGFTSHINNYQIKFLYKHI